MKTNKLESKIIELQKEGWVIVKRDSSQMNGRFYKTCKMQKDGQFVTVNHQGGILGLSSALSI